MSPDEYQMHKYEQKLIELGCRPVHDGVVGSVKIQGQSVPFSLWGMGDTEWRVYYKWYLPHIPYTDAVLKEINRHNEETMAEVSDYAPVARVLEFCS